MPQALEDRAWVESPLQLLCAVEYAARSGAPTTILLRAGSRQLRATARRVIELGLPANARIAANAVSPLRPLTRSSGRLIVGDAFSGAVHAAIVADTPRRLTVVDDGSISRLLPDVVAGHRLLERPGGQKNRALASRALERLRALNADGRLDFFSMYDLPGVTRVANDFIWLRSRRVSSPITGTVIVGSAAVVDGLATASDYLAWVASRPVPASYFPHRREARELVARVAKIPGISVVAAGLPIELQLLGAHATQIWSLPSSACDTLGMLLDDTVITVEQLRKTSEVGA